MEQIQNEVILEDLINSDENLRLFNKKFAIFINDNIHANDIYRLTFDEKTAEYQKLLEINSEKKFLNHLKNSSLVYNKMAYWVIQNQNFIEFKTLTEKHHFVPEHTRLERPKLSELINKDYNLLVVSRSVHLYLHAIRYLQFFEKDDYNTIKFSALLNRTLNLNNFDKTVYQTIKNIFVNLSTEIEEIKKKEYLDMQKIYTNIGRAAIENSVIFSQIFSDDMIWVNEKKNLRIVIPKNEVKTILQLVERLHYTLPKHITMGIDIKNYQYRHNASDYMRMYLNGVDRNKTVVNYYKNWYLKNLKCKERDENRKPFEGKIRGGISDWVTKEHIILLQDYVFFYSKNSLLKGSFKIQFYDYDFTYWDLTNELVK